MNININRKTCSKKFYFFLNQIIFKFQDKNTSKNHRIFCRKNIRQKNETIFMDFRNTKISEISKKYGLNLIVSGKKYKILCPFHEEKTASLILNDDLGTFFCFGCGASGGRYKFINKLDSKFKNEGENKIEIKTLKSNFRNSDFKISPFKKKLFFSKIVTCQCLWILQVTWGFFMANLQTNKLSKVLVNSRGISICSSKIYGLGFAPKKKNDLFGYLKNSGFKTIDIIRSGLVYSKKIKTYSAFSMKSPNIISTYFIDMFRDRLIIPIKNNSGIVIGFGGRIVNKNKIAKYINSYDSNIFKKKRLLFSEEFFTCFSKKIFKTLVITEGYLDSMSLFQNGVRFTTASLGTSLSNFQLEKLHLFCLNHHVILSFDLDEAGKMASEKILKNIFKKLNENYFCISIVNHSNQGNKKDPDEYVYYEGSVNLIKKIINYSEPILKWFEKNSITIIIFKITFFLISKKLEKNECLGFENKYKLFDKNFYEILVLKISQFNKNFTSNDSFQCFETSIFLDNFLIPKHPRFIFKTENDDTYDVLKDFEKITNLIILCSFFFPCLGEDVFQISYLNRFSLSNYFSFYVHEYSFSNIFSPWNLNIFEIFTNFFNQNPSLFINPECLKRLLLLHLVSKINLYSKTINTQIFIFNAAHIFMVLNLKKEKRRSIQKLRLLDLQILKLKLLLLNEEGFELMKKKQTLDLRRNRVNKMIKTLNFLTK
jgi:DNA primase catalytic core